MIGFGPYQLDPVQGLRRDSKEVRLTPKALAVLCTLAERAGEVVTKEELFRTVWLDTAVSDSALTSCIQELRHALHDEARRPQFIETLHRRGYRFRSPVDFHGRDDHSQTIARTSACITPQIIGRETVLEDLLKAYALAEQGARQVLFVTGEPGIGKTTVVQAFRARIAERERVRTTWGQCIQHYGAGEPYQPLLEALSRLCRQPGGDSLIPVLERHSPTWLAQLPALLAPERLATLRRTAAGTTRERMLRELTDAAEVITAQVPLILCLEDLHWTDMSTLDWLAAFAQRPEPARFLLIGTFRRPSATQPGDPLLTVCDALRMKGFCCETELHGLDEASVYDLVAHRNPPALGQEESLRHLARLVHQHTRGNPFFVVNIMADLVERGLLLQREGVWKLQRDVSRGELSVPRDVRRMIEQQVDRLPPQDRAVLEVASIAGVSFSTATVAAASQLTLNDVEASLVSLARQGQFVCDAGILEWPDGTISTRFDFRHVLYRDVLYERVPAARRSELHRAVGTREEAAYGKRAPEIAAELAMHFEGSHDLRRAGIYLQHAAENARGRSAYGEAKTHFARALALLQKEPVSPERSGREMVLHIGRGAVIMATSGWGAPEVEEAYSRARALSHELNETSGLFPALWGLWLYYWGRGPLSTAHELAQNLLDLAQRSGDKDNLLQAQHAAWASAFNRGDLEAACDHAGKGIGLYRTDRHAAMALTYGSHDPGMCSRNFLGWALALQGKTDDAQQSSDEAIALAQRLGHPFSLALASVFAAAASQARRNSIDVKRHTGEAVAIAREQDFRLLYAWASPLEGWAAVMEDRYQEGLQRIDNGLADLMATGSNSFRSYFLGLKAEALLKCGRAEAGLKAIDEAFAIALTTGERFWAAELHRLRGELLCLAGLSLLDAEQSFLQALAIAKQQDAKLLFLRASISLGRLLCRLKRRTQARKLVADARNEITQGLTLPDVVDADEFWRRES